MRSVERVALAGHDHFAGAKTDRGARGGACAGSLVRPRHDWRSPSQLTWAVRDARGPVVFAEAGLRADRDPWSGRATSTP